MTKTKKVTAAGKPKTPTKPATKPASKIGKKATPAAGARKRPGALWVELPTALKQRVMISAIRNGRRMNEEVRLAMESFYSGSKTKKK